MPGRNLSGKLKLPIMRRRILLAWGIETITGAFVTYQATTAENARRIAENEGHTVIAVRSETTIKGEA